MRGQDDAHRRTPYRAKQSLQSYQTAVSTASTATTPSRTSGHTPAHNTGPSHRTHGSGRSSKRATTPRGSSAVKMTQSLSRHDATCHRSTRDQARCTPRRSACTRQRARWSAVGDQQTTAVRSIDKRDIPFPLIPSFSLSKAIDALRTSWEPRRCGHRVERA